MILEPAEPNTGIVFQRTDLEGQPTVKTDVDFVTETNRSTTLSNNELLLAQLSTYWQHSWDVILIMCWWNWMGGNSHIRRKFTTFVEALEKRAKKQEAIKTWYTIDHNIYFLDENKKVEMVAMPANEYRINTLIDFNSPVLGTQHAPNQNLQNSTKKLLPAVHSRFPRMEYLLKNNLIKGGDLNNAIVVVDKPVTDEQLETLSKAFGKEKFAITSDGYLNNLKLRFPNEPARHKLLDLVGDLALVGLPFQSPYHCQPSRSCQQCWVC